MTTTELLLITVVAGVIAGLIWAVAEERINRDKPFDRVIAGVPLTFDPVSNTIRLHGIPTRDQLHIIEAWARDPRKPARPRTHWRVLRPL